jgi:DNA-binding beta-propeller fold protein YncE
MMNGTSLLQRSIFAGTLGILAASALPYAAGQLNSGQPQILSTNQTITPLAPRDASYNALNPNLADLPNYTVGQAVTTVISPDKKTLLVLTTGYNQNYNTATGATIPDQSTEWVFVFDISTPVAIQKQAIPLNMSDSYCGIVFNPNGTEFYVSGGDYDNVDVFDLKNGAWSLSGTPIKLGHLTSPTLMQEGIFGGNGLEQYPEAAGIDITSDGKKLVVANYENDSISILTNSGSGWAKTGEFSLQPGLINPADSGQPGGTFPFWVRIKGSDTAYITSVRDREIDVVSISGTPTLIKRIKVAGSPNKAALSGAQTHLFVTEDNTDTVAVIDTGTNTLVGEIKVAAPAITATGSYYYRGANPNSVVVAPDEQTLYITNAGENAVVVVKYPVVPDKAVIAGLIPTGFYPNSVSVSGDGTRLYIVNGKSATGPNPLNTSNSYGIYSNQYDEQLTKAGFQTLPVPTEAELASLTQVVYTNDNVGVALNPSQQAVMNGLKQKIQHIIYIIKENRTYDQVLGDLTVGDGDPNITQFGQAITPNFHAIAGNFVDFDNFYDVSDVSGDGWPWSTSARTTDTIEKEIPPNYAGRGLSNNSEGLNRDLNVGLATGAAREAADPFLVAFGLNNPNILPGTANVAAPDGPDGEVDGGYIFNAVLNAGLTVRDYGQFIDIAPYSVPPAEGGIGPTIDPYTAHQVVAVSSQPKLAPFTDPYFRGFDNNFPDYYRFTEWDREFKGFVASGKLPNLSMVRFMHDHTGNFGTAISGVNTVERQEADNDYAVGALVDAVAHSPYAGNTLIFVIEDDAQDGGDHVDAHRSTFYLVGPYVKQGYVDSTRYNTVSVLRTITDILGVGHLSLNDAHSLPMVDAFDLTQKDWTYNVTASAELAPPNTTLPIPENQFASLTPLKSLHDAQWWAAQTSGMDFSVEDHLDTPKYNLVMWKGTMGDKPYPAVRTGQNLRLNRAELLKNFHKQQQASAAGAPSKPASAPAPGGN